MRKLIFLLVVSALLLGSLLVGGTLALALGGEIHPNHYLYPFQIFSENAYAKFIPHPDWLTAYLIDLTQRRLLDLALLAGTPFELDTIQAVDTSLQVSFESYYSLDLQTYPQFTAQLLIVLEQVENLASIIKTTSYTPDSYDLLTAKLNVYHSLLTQNTTSQPIALNAETFPSVPTGTTQPTPGASDSNPQLYGFDGLIPFFPGSEGWNHAFFPLLDSHSNLNCSSCHANNTYSGTSPTCEICHSAVKPANHFPLGCETCHTPVSWTTINFSHKNQLPVDCSTCHASAKPANHFNGSCSACHSTQGWLPASFNHQAAGATDCQSCHNQTRPANHFSGQCLSCHSTTGWLPASLNHQAAGATDCQSCHTQARPANHFSGQCSSCHSTSGWLPANFNHQAAGATDCQSCHNQTRPANHFSGQCSSCHSTSSWLPASFNHQAAGATDCQSCHLGVRPANHFSGQCSSCHSTSAWIPANFNHTFPINHEGANGDCAKCHPSNPPAYNCFTCHNRAELDEKHINDKGIPDYVSRCMDCHPDGQESDD